MFEALTSRLHDEFRRLWLYRWFLFAVSLLSFVIIAAVAMSIPKSYDAWSEVYVDKQAVMSEATADVSLNAGGGSNSVMINPSVMLNDNKLQAILLKVDPQAASLSPVSMTHAINEFRKSITISSVDDNGFIQFHAKDVDPVRAARIARELTDGFIAMSVDRTQRDLGTTTVFLDGQIETFKTLLADSQLQLANYRNAHRGLVLEGGIGGPVAGGDVGGDYVTVAVPQAGAAAQAPAAPRSFPEDQRINELEGQLANLLTEYTDQHPDVIRTRRDLAAQLRSRSASAAAAAQAALTAPPAASTAAPRTTQVVRRGGGRTANVPPDIAAEWGTLLGNDSMLRADYQQLLNKQQAAKMSSAILGSTKGFEIIRPVTVPLVSYTPGRSVLLIGSFVVACIIGFALTFVRASISGVLVSPRELEEEFDLPVAGTVSWESAWQTGQVAKVDPRFIPPFLRPRVSYTPSVRLVGHDASS